MNESGRGCRNLIAKNVQEHEIAQNSRREGNVIAKAGHGFGLPSGRFQRKSGLKESVPGRVGIEEITSYVKLTLTAGNGLRKADTQPATLVTEKLFQEIPAKDKSWYERTIRMEWKYGRKRLRNILTTKQ